MPLGTGGIRLHFRITIRCLIPLMLALTGLCMAPIHCTAGEIPNITDWLVCRALALRMLGKKQQVEQLPPGVATSLISENGAQTDHALMLL